MTQRLCSAGWDAPQEIVLGVEKPPAWTELFAAKSDAVFWLAPQPWLAVTGLVILGLGNAMHYPLGIAMALQAARGQEDLAAAPVMVVPVDPAAPEGQVDEGKAAILPRVAAVEDEALHQVRAAVRRVAALM